MKKNNLSLELDMVKQTINNKPITKSKAEVINNGAAIVNMFVTIQQQFKIFHWQTFSYAEHKAFDSIYESLSDNIDEFVETYMGKYGRPQAASKFQISIANYNDSDFNSVTDSYIDQLTNTLPGFLDKEKDTDLLNIRDTILGDLNQLKYLLTLK